MALRTSRSPTSCSSARTRSRGTWRMRARSSVLRTVLRRRCCSAAPATSKGREARGEGVLGRARSFIVIAGSTQQNEWTDELAAVCHTRVNVSTLRAELDDLREPLGHLRLPYQLDRCVEDARGALGLHRED